MLSFGLKVAWFVLSLTGLVLCWMVMWALSRSVGTVWGPLLYAIGCAMLQGIFCIGMVYRMDPYRMPRAFCIAQTIIIGHSTFLMNGVAGAFAFATSLTVLKPKTWGLSSDVALKWRNIYFLPIVIFPIAASAVHIAFILKFDSTKPSDDLHCDSSDPEWVRFLGYAGIPFLVSIPCMYLSVKSVIHVYKTNQHIQRARHDEVKADKFIKAKSRAMRMKNFRVSQHSAPSPVPSAHISASRSHSLSPSRIARNFHLPFTDPPSPEHQHRDSSMSSMQDTDAVSTISSSFPTFVNPTSVSSFPETESHMPSAIQKMDEWQDILGAGKSTDTDKTSTLKWNDGDETKQAKSEYEFANEEDEIDCEIDSISWAPKRAIQSLGGMPFKRRPPLPALAPAIWRIIMFQIAYCVVQVLTCLSTIIDVAQHRSEPTPFGTQHISLLLSVWGPVFVFGYMPGVRRQLFFWRVAKTPS